MSVEQRLDTSAKWSLFVPETVAAFVLKRALALDALRKCIWQIEKPGEAGVAAAVMDLLFAKSASFVAPMSFEIEAVSTGLVERTGRTREMPRQRSIIRSSACSSRPWGRSVRTVGTFFGVAFFLAGNI